MTEKPKRKGKPKQKRHSGTKVEFLSPLPIEECIQRLNVLSDTTDLLFVWNSTRVYLKPVDGYTWDYEIRKWKYFNALVARLTGSLVAHEVSSTLVTGHAKIPLGQYLGEAWFVVMSVAILITVVLTKNLAPLLVFIVSASIATLNWRMLSHSRRELLYLIEDTLR